AANAVGPSIASPSRRTPFPGTVTPSGPPGARKKGLPAAFFTPIPPSSGNRLHVLASDTLTVLHSHATVREVKKTLRARPPGSGAGLWQRLSVLISARPIVASP